MAEEISGRGVQLIHSLQLRELALAVWTFQVLFLRWRHADNLIRLLISCNV